MWLLMIIAKCSERIPLCPSTPTGTNARVIVMTMLTPFVFLVHRNSPEREENTDVNF